MKSNKSILILALAVAGFSPNVANAAIVITEVHANGSSASYNFDWFEVTNTDLLSSLNLSGWQMDDNSNGTAKVALRGVTSIGPGQTIVFFEGNSTGGGTTNSDSTRVANFNAAWGTSLLFGTTIGAYAGGGGAGVSLSGTGDAVNLFDSLGAPQANVVFGAATTAVTFDNAAGLNNATISQLSVVGINGAFTSFTGNEIGSPGVIPEPSSLALVAIGAAVATFRRTRRD